VKTFTIFYVGAYQKDVFLLKKAPFWGIKQLISELTKSTFSKCLYQLIFRINDGQNLMVFPLSVYLSVFLAMPSRAISGDNMDGIIVTVYE
jgi:hypothetical protein